MALADRIIGAESGGRATVKNPNSSATGAGQFIDSTWLAMVAKHRPDLAGLPRSEVLGLRNDPSLSREMTQAYADDNSATLRSAGLATTPGNIYLAHFAGPTGAKSVLSADPSTPVSALLTPDAIAANKFLQGRTAGWLTDWAAQKVGGGATMRMPAEGGGGAASGRFGFTGIEPSSAPAPTMATPAGSEDKPTDYGALLKLVAGNQGFAALAQPQTEPAEPSRLPAPAPRRPVAFDLDGFLARLPR